MRGTAILFRSLEAIDRRLEAEDTEASSPRRGGPPWPPGVNATLALGRSRGAPDGQRSEYPKLLANPVPNMTLPTLPAASKHALGVALTLAIGLWVWLANGDVVGAVGLPAWASASDSLLDGPDAGAWAGNATAISLGRTVDLDPHRLPVYPYLTALAMWITPDVAFAGHLVNHLCLLLLGPVVYLLGARWMQQGLALGAAVVCALWIPGIAAAQRYGVDPVIALAVPLSLLAAEAGAWRWWAAPFAGFVIGLAAATHLTTVGLPVAALLLCLFRATPGARWPCTALLLAGCSIGVGAIHLRYPHLPHEMLATTLAEGIEPVANNAGRAGIEASSSGATDAVRAGLPAAVTAVMRFVASTTRPAWLAWHLALVVPWLGLVGPGLFEGRIGPPIPRSGGEMRKLAGRLLAGLAVGVPALIALAPLVAFAAASSPQRYTDNFVAVVVLVVFRGFGLLTALASVRLGPVHKELVALAVALVVAGGIVSPRALTLQAQRSPTDEMLAIRQLGTLIRTHFPPGGGASCTLREADAYAGRVFCPYSQGAAYAGKPDAVALHLSSECSGEGDIPYVVLTGANDGAGEGRKRMDEWVMANATLVDELVLPQFSARLYGVARVEVGER